VEFVLHSTLQTLFWAYNLVFSLFFSPGYGRIKCSSVVATVCFRNVSGYDKYVPIYF